MHMERCDDAIAILWRGTERLPSENDLASLFNRLGKLLFELERYDDSINALRKGIELIPPGKSLASLYVSCSGLFSQMKRYDEAIEILNQGIQEIPLDNLASLFHKLGKLLSELDRHDEAISLLERGIKHIPPDKSLTSLYFLCAELLEHKNKPNKAISLLRRGITHIPTDKSLTSLYQLCGELLQRVGKLKEAAAILKEGINRIPIDKGLPVLYVRCSEVLFQLGKQDQAMFVLQKGMHQIPLDNVGIVGIYITYVKLLLSLNQVEKAIKILLDGTNQIYADDQIVQSALYECVVLLYSALRDEKSITQFIHKTRGLPPKIRSLAKALVYQVQENWEEAATYARDIRRNGNRNSLLSTIEAFSWLSAGYPERALEAIFLNLREDNYFDHWLNSFIQFRLGNLEEAKKSLQAYTSKLALAEELEANETILLSTWDQPSSSLISFDLAYYFPTLPSVLTGLPYPETRVTYCSSVLPIHIKSETSKLSHPDRKNKDENIAVDMKEVMQENYVDFDLYIDAHGHVTATSPQGQVDEYIETQQPSSMRLSWRLIEQRQTDADLLKEVGCALYEWLFPNSIHTHLQQTEAAARQDQAKLRLRMRIEPSNIARLPLEFVYRSIGGYFLSTNPNTVFSRYLNIPLPSERIRRHSTPLHVLAIIADPIDQARLNPDEWEMLLKEALDSHLKANRMTLQTVKSATRKDIRNALLSQKPDIVQFVGHGIYQSGKGQLALVEDQTNKTWLVDDARFADIFNGFDDYLRLISLATCESGQSDDPQGFLGIAPQLVQRGTPAVVAMQYKVYTETAKVFLEDFYTCVAAYKPIDWAVQSARKAISLEFGLDNREFATPVLYMRAKDCDIF